MLIHRGLINDLCQLYTTVITTWFKCVPLSREQQCISSMDFVAYATFAGAYSAAMDFVLAFIPWPLIWSLQLKKKEKLGVAVAMSLGVIAGATATMKCLAIQTIAQGDFTCWSPASQLERHTLTRGCRLWGLPCYLGQC